MDTECDKKLERKKQLFLNKIFKDENGCWIWTAGKTNGYGVFLGLNKKQIKAHRFSYEVFLSKIPDGMVIDHLCRNRSCVNPDHLEPVTTRENNIRGIGVAGINKNKTHCKNGHEFNSKNTFIDKKRGWRVCRICSRKRTTNRRHPSFFT